MEKSPEAFRTITEVSELLDVPAHVLRFWETKFPQIRPLKRKGGRRNYRPADVALINGIRTLLYREGFTIRGVQRILKEHGVKFVHEIGRGEGDLTSLASLRNDRDGQANARVSGAGARQSAAEATGEEARASSPLSTAQRQRLEQVLVRLRHVRTKLNTLATLAAQAGQGSRQPHGNGRHAEPRGGS